MQVGAQNLNYSHYVSSVPYNTYPTSAVQHWHQNAPSTFIVYNCENNNYEETHGLEKKERSSLARYKSAGSSCESNHHALRKRHYKRHTNSISRCTSASGRDSASDDSTRSQDRSLSSSWSSRTHGKSKMRDPPRQELKMPRPVEQTYRLLCKFTCIGKPTEQIKQCGFSCARYRMHMDDHSLHSFRLKCRNDEIGVVLVFEAEELDALAVCFITSNIKSECDVILTNRQTVVVEKPTVFVGSFVIMLRRLSSLDCAEMRAQVIDDILTAREWFDCSIIRLKTINPIISTVCFETEHLTTVLTGQEVQTRILLDAVNANPLFCHPEAKGLTFKPEVILIPAFQLSSIPFKVIPNADCSLRPNVSIVLQDLRNNQEKFSFPTSFMVYGDLPHIMKIHGFDVVLVNDRTTCEHAVNEILYLNSGHMFVDTEWKPMSAAQKNKVAVIQICCAHRAYVIHIAKFRDDIPELLFDLLKKTDIFKIGLAISYDSKKLSMDYNTRISPMLDIRDFTWFQDRDKKSLAFLVDKILQGKKPSGNKTTMSNWENDLDQQQLEYAALDVIHLAEIFVKLFGEEPRTQLAAINMFSRRQNALTKTCVEKPMRPELQQAPPPRVESESLIKVVDANDQAQYFCSPKKAKRLLRLRQARKQSQNVIQLV